MLSRIVDRQRGLVLIVSGLVAGSAALYTLYGPRALAALLAAALIFLTVKLGAGVLAQLNARTPLSLRWKITGAISLMLAILLGVALIALAGSNSMHSDVHAIQELQGSAPQPAIARTLREAQGPQAELLRQMQIRLETIPAALDNLEDRQHSILTWIPLVIFGGGLVAVALGMALSSSLIGSIRQMSEATRRIAGGDFSQPVDVPNRDELGELATGLNNAAQDLGRLQEALLAEERARSLQERVAQVTLAQEEERRRITRELHDGLGPSLADLGNRLSVCRQLVRADPLKAETGLDEVTALLREHIKEIRELINELRPLALDQLGLVEAPRQYIERQGEESGIEAHLKHQIIKMSQKSEAKIFTDPRASPTGFPFKIVELNETISNKTVYEERARICDLSYLRHAYKKENGKVGWRCPSEPVDDYVRKGGDIADTVGRKCVCNGLLANIGLGQYQKNGEVELPLVTSGDDVAHVARFLKPGASTYSALDVIAYLLRDVGVVMPGETSAIAAT